jgi:hypothetical protein
LWHLSTCTRACVTCTLLVLKYVARSCGLAFGMARSARWTCCRSWRVIASVSVPRRQLSNPSWGTSTCTHVPGKRTRISMCPMPSPGNQCAETPIWTATIRIVDNCFSMAQHQPNPLVCIYYVSMRTPLRPSVARPQLVKAPPQAAHPPHSCRATNLLPHKDTAAKGRRLQGLRHRSPRRWLQRKPVRTCCGTVPTPHQRPT